MDKKFHFLNHTSIMLQHDNHTLLLDPWPTESLSFESWKPHPPCYLDNNILASFINSSNNKSGILISHGHDDHCDDVFLKKVSSSTPIFFPEYEGKGAMKRLRSNDLKNITLLNQTESKSFGPFRMSSFIISKHSQDDAVIIIDTDDYVFIHANDNSVEFPPELIKIILEINGGLKKTYFASQTGIAHGFPVCYPQFGAFKDLDKVREVAMEKNKKTIQTAIDNANAVKSTEFISYAAYSISLALLDKYGEDILPVLFVPTPKNLKKISLNWGKLNLLDYVPGDTYDVTNNYVFRPFWLNNGFENMSSELQKLRLSSTKKHKEDLNIKAEQFSNYTSDDLTEYMKNYLKNFYDFVLKSNSPFKDNVMKSSLVFQIENEVSVGLNFKDGSITTEINFEPNKRITISRDDCWLLLSGIFNFESLYIGQYAKFERFPPEVFNKQLIMQLQIYGYVYQKRLVPKKLSVNNYQKNFRLVSFNI